MAPNVTDDDASRKCNSSSYNLRFDRTGSPSANSLGQRTNKLRVMNKIKELLNSYRRCPTESTIEIHIGKLLRWKKAARRIKRTIVAPWHCRPKSVLALPRKGQNLWCRSQYLRIIHRKHFKGHHQSPFTWIKIGRHIMDDSRMTALWNYNV